MKRNASRREPQVSASEQLLFGGPLTSDMGWNQHEDAFLHLSPWGMVRSLPKLMSTSLRLAGRADRRALAAMLGAETGRGITQAIGLICVNLVLAHLISAGTVTERLSAAVPALLLAGVVAMVGALLRSLSIAATGHLEPKVQRVATEDYLERVARVELAAVEDDEFHKLLETASWGADSARRMVKYVSAVINALISIVAAAGVLAILHWALLPLLVVMVLPHAWSALVTARRRYVSFHVFVQHSRAAQLLGRLLIEPEAAPEIRAHDVGPFLLRHYRAMAETNEREQTRLSRLDALTELAASVGAGLAAAATYGMLGLLLWQGSMDLAVAGTAVIAIKSGASNLSSLVIQVNELHREGLFVGDLDVMCAEADRRAIPATGRALPDSIKTISFDSVTFTYPGQSRTPALSDVSLTIPIGKTVALVGVNGSGKSTLAKLLCGLYTPDSGRVLWEGVDTSEADRKSIFSRVALLTQDHYRWPFTARANVGIGRPDGTFGTDELDRAARLAHADDVIGDLPYGWDTLLARGYKGGHQISGGQWQRIGMARAHHRNADVLIVDEPTSALDAEAEQRAFDQLRTLADGGQTIVLITHRLHSVRHADEIYVLDNGRVAEQGSFTELMDPEREGLGLFRNMYRIQSEQFQSIPAAPVDR